MLLYLYPACALVLMALTWPRPVVARRVLRRWGDIAEPTPDQLAVVVRYLRERRLLVLPLMVLAPFTASGVRALIGPADDLGLYHLLGSLLVAWLLAEVVASVRPRRGALRTASLEPRGWRGLVPVWAVALHIGLTVLAIVLGGGLLISVASTALVVVYGICLLAVLRPATADLEVDQCLRLRSARVAVGVGVLLAALLVAAGLPHGPSSAVIAWASGVLFVVALVGWSGVIAAPRYG
jgi:hypothetical protein